MEETGDTESGFVTDIMSLLEDLATAKVNSESNLVVKVHHLKALPRKKFNSVGKIIHLASIRDPFDTAVSLSDQSKKELDKKRLGLSYRQVFSDLTSPDIALSYVIRQMETICRYGDDGMKLLLYPFFIKLSEVNMQLLGSALGVSRAELLEGVAAIEKLSRESLYTEFNVGVEGRGQMVMHEFEPATAEAARRLFNKICRKIGR
jgi:hypothetical protein